MMKVDGTGQARLTYMPDIDFNPTWSPDGTKIAFSKYRAGRFFEIWMMNADGSGENGPTITLVAQEPTPWTTVDKLFLVGIGVVIMVIFVGIGLLATE